MKPINSAGITFNPPDPPSDPAQLQRYLRELNTLHAATFALLARKNFEMLTVPPAKPRNGDPVYADGVLWNPGGGKGLYVYTTPANVYTLIKALP